ncbi:adenosylcobinamide-phosphate synthase CbiB [Calothrix sp. 336/3]|uniref:adenosylcobinamide-phosphate synthase CbiB n=1 Tax=Calothrix sp. 336/3 TaxID=1337936 RepID=UPI0004E33B28|nr:adenosylcobinamide-phosphate synthase CbiB [Calothrix sp. 336/3]AKG20726.1 cobalamin biosynthesis protein CobD [Calothrix sp. 336/3]
MTVLLIAAILDYIIGDPWGWIHPVQVMGWVITSICKLVWQYCHSSLTQRLAGIGLAILVIFGSAIATGIIVQIAKWVHPIFAIATESIILASCFAGRSLRQAAETVLQPLILGDITAARSALSNFVGRDTDSMDDAEILRAVLETVTENAIDGVMAPLFYAIMGIILSDSLPLAAPLAIAYKAISTLDSMVGYKEPPYTYLGWFSAKLEDFLTYIPCRLSVFTLGLISRKPLEVWRICQRDAPQDPSPNSGWSECIYAAILGVQVGGKNIYRGVIKYKPLLGDAIQPITADVVLRATRLTRYCFFSWLGVTGLLLMGINR